jgi:hypothetical protein
MISFRKLKGLVTCCDIGAGLYRQLFALSQVTRWPRRRRAPCVALSLT